VSNLSATECYGDSALQINYLLPALLLDHLPYIIICSNILVHVREKRARQIHQEDFLIGRLIRPASPGLAFPIDVLKTPHIS
jgi:hypothetical protein